MHFVVTRGIKAEMDNVIGFVDFVENSIHRIMQGDWGDCCREDKKTNDEALHNGSRLFGVYRHDKFRRIWIIVDAENDEGVREYATVLFPDEY